MSRALCCEPISDKCEQKSGSSATEDRSLSYIEESRQEPETSLMLKEFEGLCFGVRKGLGSKLHESCVVSIDMALLHAEDSPGSLVDAPDGGIMMATFVGLVPK